MPRSLRLLILTEGSVLWGLGHLQRCFAYADAFLQKGYEVRWLVEGDEMAKNFLLGKDGSMRSWQSDLSQIDSAHFFLIDSYYVSQRHLYQLSQMASCIYLDDFARLEYPPGVVVNGVPLADQLPYQINEKSSLLAGPKYQALRGAFRNQKLKAISSSVQNILVMMGGTDLRELSPLVAQKARLTYPSAEIRIVVPLDSQRQRWQQELPELIWLGSQSDDQVKALMEWADLGISNAGQTLFEVCFIGLPTIAIGVVENQSYNLRGFGDARGILALGWWNEDLEAKLEIALDKMKSFEIRKEISSNAQRLVDGMGVHRVFELATQWSFQIRLRLAQPEDSNLIWNLSNHLSVREYSLSKSEISWENHSQWFETKRNDPQLLFLVIEDLNGDFLGQLRYQKNEEYSLVSLSLMPHCRGRGLASKVLREGDQRCFAHFDSIRRIQAEISTANIASQTVFARAGYSKSQFSRKIDDQCFELYIKEQA